VIAGAAGEGVERTAHPLDAHATQGIPCLFVGFPILITVAFAVRLRARLMCRLARLGLWLPLATALSRIVTLLLHPVSPPSVWGLRARCQSGASLPS